MIGFQITYDLYDKVAAKGEAMIAIIFSNGVFGEFPKKYIIPVVPMTAR